MNGYKRIVERREIVREGAVTSRTPVVSGRTAVNDETEYWSSEDVPLNIVKYVLLLYF